LLDGTGTAEQYVQQAVAHGQGSLAITDHGTLAGVLHHITACEAAGIKPICGVEAYFRPDRFDRQSSIGGKALHLVLLAQNQEGWRNLLRLTTEAHASNQSADKPCVDWKLLEQYREGIICGTACLSSPIGKAVQEGIDPRPSLQRLRTIFGSRLFLEIMPNAVPAQKLLNAEILTLSQEFSLPVCATVDAHFPYAEWVQTQDVLLMISTGQSNALRKKKRDRGEDVYEIGEPSLYLMDEADLLKTFHTNHPELDENEVQQAIKNTELVASTVQAITIDKRSKLPKVSNGSKTPQDPEVTIRSWCQEGLRKKGKTEDQDYKDRIEYELGIIANADAMDYMVMIGDMVRWARAKGIRVGPGRGSAAGSLVSYLIGITNLDPIAHDLLFERFLNPNRKEMPDIDIDFQEDRRQEVIDYLAQRWGRDHVVPVSSYQTFGVRSALKETARVFDVPLSEADAITKMLDDDVGDLKLNDLRDVNDDLDRFANDYPEVWEHATRLEGQVRSLSRHPAGVIVTDKPVRDYMPLVKGKDGKMATAWSEAKDFRVITNYGFPKVDVLGLTSLAATQLAVDLIKKHEGIELDLDNLGPEADPNAFDPQVVAEFANKLTLGIFQFSSSGLTGLLGRMKPDRFDDLTAANALYRPGPLGSGATDQYVRRKRGEEPVTFWHDSLKPILGGTLGIMAYQEQVMRMAVAVGGFSPKDADDVRKAITKETSAKRTTNQGMRRLEKLKQQFVTGAKQNGVAQGTAEEIWKGVLDFARYSFNKSHSAAYSMMAYQEMYLKHYYPAYFYAAWTTHRPSLAAKFVREAQLRGYSVEPPHINESDVSFTVVDPHTLRFGLGAVKFIGDTGLKEIVAEREKGGPFADVDDFRARIRPKVVNRRGLEALVNCGAFDWAGERQGATDRERIDHERELLGFSLSAMSKSVQYQDVLIGYTHSQEHVDDAQDREYVTIGGEVTGVRETTTRKGEGMAFVDVAHELETYSVVCFPRLWDTYASILAEGETILVSGTKDAERGSILLKHAVEVEEFAKALTQEEADRWSVPEVANG
jgi:DNA polymerase-3 subunit alpha